MIKSHQHIVFLTPGFPSSKNDYITIPALQVFLKNLKRKIPQAKLSVITFQFPETSIPYNWFDYSVIPLNGKNKKHKKLWTWHKANRALTTLNQIKKITAIHSFWIGECSYIAQKFAIKNNIPHIVTAMGREGIINNKYIKFINPEKSKLVSLSINQQNDLFNNYNLKSLVIPWAVQTNYFPTITEKNSIDILGVGFLNSNKNYAAFIKTIAIIKNKYPNIHVEIIGNGSQLTKLKKLIKKYNLEKNIFLVGQLSRKNVLEKMSKSNVFLHTSSYESFGFVFSEALYSGMKIVSFNVGFSKNSEIWKIGDNIDQLAEHCTSFLSNINSQKKRVNLHKIDATLQSYIALYNSKNNK